MKKPADEKLGPTFKMLKVHYSEYKPLQDITNIQNKTHTLRYLKTNTDSLYLGENHY